MNALNCTVCGKMIAYSRHGLDVLDPDPMCSYCIALHKAAIRELISGPLDLSRLTDIEDEYL